MRSDIKYTDTSGRFQMGPGFEVVFEPGNSKGSYPLEVVRNGDESNPLLVLSDRPLRLVPWETLAVRGRDAGEEWYVTVADRPGEALGDRGLRPSPQRLFQYTTASNLALTTTGTDLYRLDTMESIGQEWDRVLSLGRFSRYLLQVSYGTSITSSGGWTPLVKPQLMLVDGEEGVARNSVPLELTLSNGPSAGRAFVYFELGAGVVDETSATAIRRGMLWPYAAAVLQVGTVEMEAAAITLVGGFTAELWGWP